MIRNDSHSPRFEVQENGANRRVLLYGSWDYELPKELIASLFTLLEDKSLTNISLKHVSSLDYAAAVLLLELCERANTPQKPCELSEIPEKLAHILKNAHQSSHRHTDKLKSASKTLRSLLYSYAHTLVLFCSFVGEVLSALFYLLRHPHLFRLKAMLFHIEESGIKAIPIIALTSFLVGIVMAYQGALQLEKFGASLIVIEMTAMLTLRELAPVITAIVLAGRNASSYTAQIGVMNITEELEAMQTMNFNPHIFLVIPRIIALIIAMPFVIFFANLTGIAGEMLIINSYLGISSAQYLERFYEMVEIRHFWAGIIKAPFYGAIIALIGCFRGFQITSSTESVGRYTTISVVNAIFWVIALNAAFSVILTEFSL
ncbi:MAG: MlaE family lipid ABC transporter permease subunit [Wolinella sp.]